MTQFSRVSQLGRNRGYGGTRWVVMIMQLTIYGNTKKGYFDGLYKRSCDPPKVRNYIQLDL